jgi:hypothetical protein
LHLKLPALAANGLEFIILCVVFITAAKAFPRSFVLYSKKHTIMKKHLFIYALALLPLSAAAQPQNLGFEQWDNPVTAQMGANRPSGWIWSNGTYTNPLNTFYYAPVQEAHDGNFAVMLSVWYNYTKDMAIQHTSIDYRPESLNGFYKYADNQIGSIDGPVTDIAQVSVYLTHWDPVLLKRDTVAGGVIDLGASAEFAAFDVPIHYASSQMPDSVLIRLDPSMLNRISGFFQPDDGITSFLTVDDLSFEGDLLGTDELPKTAVSVFPNPATDVLHFGDFAGTVSVRDASGRTFLANRPVAPGTALPIGELPAGMYFVELSGDQLLFHSPIIKQ